MAEPARFLSRSNPERSRERAVLILCVAILLASISVATFPCWSYSARWGHGPSAIAGLLLLGVAVAAVGARWASSPKVAPPGPEIASAAPPKAFQ